MRGKSLFGDTDIKVFKKGTSATSSICRFCKFCNGLDAVVKCGVLFLLQYTTKWNESLAISARCSMLSYFNCRAVSRNRSDSSGIIRLVIGVSRYFVILDKLICHTGVG